MIGILLFKIIFLMCWSILVKLWFFFGIVNFCMIFKWICNVFVLIILMVCFVCLIVVLLFKLVKKILFGFIFLIIL